MTVGTAGLLWLKTRAAPLQARREALLNSSFLLSLNAASTSGLLLLTLRDTRAMGALLVLHLGTIVALYVTAPGREVRAHRVHATPPPCFEAPRSKPLMTHGGEARRLPTGRFARSVSTSRVSRMRPRK